MMQCCELFNGQVELCGVGVGGWRDSTSWVVMQCSCGMIVVVYCADAFVFIRWWWWQWQSEVVVERWF